MTIKESVMSQVSEFPESRLYAIQEYIDFLDFRETKSTEHCTPLDDFDYELARRADEHKGEETFTFDEVLRELGMTYEDLRD